MQFAAQKKDSLSALLQEKFPDVSKTQINRWITGKRISVDRSLVVKPHALVEEGATVRFLPKKKFLEQDVEILFEDEEIAVIHKPAGLLSVETPYEKTLSVHAILKKHYKGKRVFPVHRLDRDTSGLLVFALSENAKEILKEAFAEHRIFRRYLAIVEGSLQQEEGTWTSFLKETAGFKMRSSHEGKKAVTHFKRVYASSSWSLLLVQLETGRKNQIRVQAGEAGFPILGDKKYGAISLFSGRLALHACDLGFTHPVNGKLLQFSSPLPEAFQKYIGKKEVIEVLNSKVAK